MKIAFVHNFCTHYTKGTFELLAQAWQVHFYFYSKGKERFWLKEHGVAKGNFYHEYLRGFALAGRSITPSLLVRLIRGKYDLYIQSIDNPFAVLITYFVALFRRKPLVVWTGIWMRLGSSVHRLTFPILRHIYKRASAIVVYGDHVKHYLISEGIDGEKIFIAPHAVDNEQYNRQVTVAELTDLKVSLAIRPEQKILLYVGRLTAEKGLDHLFEAFSAVNRQDVVLLLVGSGSEQFHLKQLADEKGILNQIRFVGYIPNHKIDSYYALAWISILPSVTTRLFKEPWGLVVNEAFNQGVPVIATDSVGAAAGGLVQDGVNGLVVPERNSSALSYAIERLLDDPDLRARLSEAAKKKMTTWDQKRMILGFQDAVEYASSKC